MRNAIEWNHLNVYNVMLQFKGGGGVFKKIFFFALQVWKTFSALHYEDQQPNIIDLFTDTAAILILPPGHAIILD